MRIGWILSGQVEAAADGRLISQLASNRLRCLEPAICLGETHDIDLFAADELRAQPPDARFLAPDLFVVGKAFADLSPVLREARRHGKPVVVDLCDNVFALDHLRRPYAAMLEEADAITVATEALGAAIEAATGHHPIVVPDCAEGVPREPAFAPEPDAPLQLLWFGQPANLTSLAALLPDLARLHQARALAITAVTRWQEGVVLDDFAAGGPGIERVEWSLAAMAGALDACDLVLVPSRADDATAGKTANRLMTALQAGRLPIAFPLPSYAEFADFAWLGEDLCAGLDWALANPAAVRERIAGGQAFIAANYAPAAIAGRWEAALAGALGGTDPAADFAGEVRLNLGCGDKPMAGYLNLDLASERAGRRPDIVCDIAAPLPLPDASADEILAVHVIEHFWRWQVREILADWLRVLKPGGRMILECPNLISACQALLAEPERAAGDGPDGQRSMWVFYGDPRWQDPLMCHRWAYTPQSLAQTMADCGLVALRQEPAQFKLREPRDMRIVGDKVGTRNG